MIIIYTGNGKGKTTAALGLVLRSLCDKKKVILIQFIKSKKESGEVSLKYILPKLEIKCFGIGFVSLKHKNIKILKQNINIIEHGIKFVQEIIKLNKYNLIILDEILVAYNLKLIKLNNIIKLIKLFNSSAADGNHKALVLTGRGCPKSLYKFADLVTEMKEIKHPSQKGIEARPGIEY